MSDPRGSAKKTSRLRLAGTLIAVALLIYLLSEQGWAEILKAIQAISLWQFVAALLLILGSRTAVCARWHVLLLSANIKISLSQTTRITFAGLFASNFLPTTIGGDVVRLAGAIQLGYDGVVSGASLVVDRLVGMAGMAMALPFGLSAFNAALRQSLLPHPWLSLASTSALPPGERFRSFWTKWTAKMMGLSSRLFQALSLWVRQPGVLLAALGFSWVHMLLHFAAIWLLLDYMEDPIPFWLIAGLWSAVYFITLLPVSINGYGLQEISLALIFTRAGGISAPNALTIALLVRTMTMLASLPGAAFVPGIMAGRSAASSLNQGN